MTFNFQDRIHELVSYPIEPEALDSYWDIEFTDEDMRPFRICLSTILEHTTTNRKIEEKAHERPRWPKHIRSKRHQLLRALNEVCQTISPHCRGDSLLFKAAFDIKKKFITSFFDLFEGDAVQLFRIHAEAYLDGIGYAIHMFDTTIKRNCYRDHFVHPLIVAMFGFYWLLKECNNKDTLLQQAVVNLKTRIKPTLGIPEGEFEEKLRDAFKDELRDTTNDDNWEHFVCLVWLLAAINHDHGRFLEILLDIHGFNSAKTNHSIAKVFPKLLPPFISLSQERRLIEGHKKKFLDFLKGCCDQELEDIYENIKKRMDKLVALDKSTIDLTSLNGKGKKTLDYYRKTEKDAPDVCDHAIFSAAELFLISDKVNTDSPEGSILAGALKLAVMPVLCHHFGSHKSFSHSLLKNLTWEKNPLGIILRLCDFFHDCGRLFLADTDPKPNRGKRGNQGEDTKTGDPLEVSYHFKFSRSSSYIKADTVSKADIDILLEMPSLLDESLKNLRLAKGKNEQKEKVEEMKEEREEEVKHLNQWLRNEEPEFKCGLPFKIEIDLSKKEEDRV